MNKKMRPPARSSISAHTLNWHSADSELFPFLKSTEFCDHHVEVAFNAENKPAYLRIHLEVNWVFAKVVSLEASVMEARSFALTKALFEYGIATPRPLWQRNFDDHWSVFAYSWVAGDHPAASTLNFYSLGEEIAKLHKILRRLPDQDVFLGRTQKRLSDLLTSLSNLDTPLEKIWQQWYSQANECLAIFSDLSSAIQRGGSPIHGDLNAGNILVADDQFVFLDFEDATHSALWPGLDIAKIVERLVLPYLSDGNLGWAQTAIAELLNGYASCADSSILSRPDLKFSDALKWHMGLASALMTTQPFSQTVRDAEMTKFAKLLFMIDHYQNLFDLN